MDSLYKKKYYRKTQKKASKQYSRRRGDFMSGAAARTGNANKKIVSTAL